jgi:hypothetical protein
MTELLPWLNLLLLPIIYAAFSITQKLTRIETWMGEHDKLDAVRFGEIERRITAIELCLPHVRKRNGD